jgi:hypothetical protein
LGSKKDFTLFDFLALVIPVAGLIGSGLSLYKKFDASLVLILALSFASLCALIFFRRTAFIPKITAPKRVAILFSLILVASTAARWPPFLYLAGGQDQGVYVSLASYIDRTGDFNVTDDPTLALVPEESRDYYLKQRPAFYGGYFSFYPVHPVLMAISKNILGESMTTLPNALIGVLTAIVFYLITLLITKNRNLGLLMMAFIAFHPLHRFFSIFPVTEIPSLFFTSTAFYYFLKFTQTETGSRPRIEFLLFSAVYWTAFLFTRMNSFIYLPLLYSSLLLTPFVVAEKSKKSILTFYFAFLVGSVVCSFWIYSVYMPILYEIIAEQTLYKPFGTNYQTKLMIFGALAICLPMFLSLTKNKSRNFLLGLYQNTKSRTAFVALSFIAILYLGSKAMTAAVDGTSSSMVAIINRYAFATDWQLISATNLWTTFIYLSPFGFCIYVYKIWSERHTTSHTKAALLVFPLYYLIITLATTPVVFGGFYYSRYQISEIIPFALLFIVVTFFNSEGPAKISRRATAIWVTLFVCYFIGYTSQQFQGSEGPRPKFYQEISKVVTDRDLIVVDGSAEGFRGYNEIIQPLEFFYDENIVRIANVEQMASAEFRTMASGFAKVFFFSLKDIEHPAFQNKTPFEYNFGMYHNNTGHIYLPWASLSGDIKRGNGARVFSVPTLFSKYVATYYFYDIEKTKFADQSLTKDFGNH